VNEDKSARYHRLTRQAAVLSTAAAAASLGALALTGAAVWLRAALAAHGDPAYPSPGTVALYVTVLALLHEAVTVPFAYYRTFILERRYGLSFQHARDWLRDHAKGAALGVSFAIAAAEVVYWTMRASPGRWWIVSAVIFWAVLAAGARLAPIVLFPLFYRFKPLDRESLRGRLGSLFERAGVPILGIFEWGLGERTRRANAALVGAGSTRRILLSDTLLAEYADDEIEVILAHELAHHVHRDLLQGLAVEGAVLVAALYAAASAINAWWQPLGLAGPSDLGGLPLLILAVGAVSLSATPLANAISRVNERRADRYALTLTERPDAFRSAMQRLAAQNLAEERPSRPVLWMFHAHPPMYERIDAARAFEDSAGIESARSQRGSRAEGGPST
jgi:STE24 endopeptidase